MSVELSILVIVRNWSTVRLELSLASILEARKGLNAEVILLDYGSDETNDYMKLAEQYAANYYRAEADVWSRSRAVNVASSLAKGRWILTADADMLWSPNSLRKSLELVREDPHQFLVYQARDLSPTHNGDHLSANGYGWDELESVSIWRPRWGMGMLLVSAEKFMHVQGLDERMTIWGAEDADFARRLRASGLRQHWVQHDEVRVYHVWHEDSKAKANTSPEGAQALENNRQILYKDPTTVRNVAKWENRAPEAAPLISVVIVTRDRQEYLIESINSVLNQTFSYFEIVVIDDGEEGGVESRLHQLEDERIRYFKAPRNGVAAGRNFGAEVSRGIYTAIHDDDDIMLPWSLESRLQCLEPGDAGSYGGFWNFDHDTGDLELVPGKAWSLRGVYSGKVAGHPTMLVETDLIRRVGYDETIQAGSDYKFRTQIALAGYHLRHCDDVVTLRRMHTRNMSVVDLGTQRGTSDLVNSVLRFSMGGPEKAMLREATRDKKVPVVEIPEVHRSQQRVRTWMPGHLVKKVAIWRQSDEQPTDLWAKPAISVRIHSANGTAHYVGFIDMEPKEFRQLYNLDQKYGEVSVLGIAVDTNSQSGDYIPDMLMATIAKHEEGDPSALRPYYAVEMDDENGYDIYPSDANIELDSLKIFSQYGNVIASPSNGTRSIFEHIDGGDH